MTTLYLILWTQGRMQNLLIGGAPTKSSTGVGGGEGAPKRVSAISFVSNHHINGKQTSKSADMLYIHVCVVKALVSFIVF